MCSQNWPQMCDNPIANGINWNGGYAEYTIPRAQAAVRVPADVDAVQVAPLLCTGSAVFNALRLAGESFTPLIRSLNIIDVMMSSRHRFRAVLKMAQVE
ncbi:hypothetical protein F4815DRAFT_380771 [Daldinia loculata]|nr:hypothetical protein F4815DRAFT_380771 [Daldinia loculata]